MPRPPFIIRRVQLDALSRAREAAFLERLAGHVTRVFPSHAAMVRGRRGERFMRSCIARAGAYGIREGRAVAMFADLVIALGDDFDSSEKHAWIREILASELGDTGKMYLIYKKLPERAPGPPTAMPEEYLEPEPEEDRGRRVPILVRANLPIGGSYST